MQSKLAVFALGIVVVASAFGASAFTTASVDRTATINVQGDSSGLIGLDAGDNEFVTQDTNDQLAIDVIGHNNAGVNSDATFQIGNTTSPAFTLANNFTTTQSLELNYTVTGTDSSTDPNLEFVVYNESDSDVGSFTENGGLTLSDVTAGETHTVVIHIDTTGLTSDDDLSGTLNVTA